MNTAMEAVKLGILRAAPENYTFPGKHGNQKQHVVDSRGAGTNLRLRTLILSEMQRLLQEIDQHEVIVGIAKSGIMWGSWLALWTSLPYATVLPDESRKSGLQRSVEGNIEGSRVVLIDNWVRSGQTLQAAARKISAEGGVVAGAILISCPDRAQLLFPGCRVIWSLQELIDAQSQIESI